MVHTSRRLFGHTVARRGHPRVLGLVGLDRVPQQPQYALGRSLLAQEGQSPNELRLVGDRRSSGHGRSSHGVETPARPRPSLGLTASTVLTWGQSPRQRTGLGDPKAAIGNKLKSL